MTSLVRRISGEIAYRGPDGSEEGREYFELASHRGGHMLRALCVLDTVDLLRDVTLAMDRDWRPTDGYCRLVRDGDTEAAFWFRVREDGVAIDSRVRGRDMARRHVATDGRLGYLGLHPLQGDALIVERRGIDRPGDFVPIAALTNSVSPNGDDEDGVQLIEIDVAYCGEEMVEVQAGRFAARRYALRWRADWPAADLWVRREDSLFLLMRWAQVPTWYELATFEETT